MVPGKIISIETAITNGADVLDVLNNALSAAGIIISGAAFTTKKQSEWNVRECVGFMINNGLALSVCRRKGANIERIGGYDNRYDITADAGQTFYVLEAVQ